MVNYGNNESFPVALEKQTFDLFPGTVELQLFLESWECQVVIESLWLLQNTDCQGCLYQFVVILKFWVGSYDLIEIFRAKLSDLEGAFFELNKLEEVADCRTTLHNVHVLKIDQADQTAARGITLNHKHLRHGENLVFYLLLVFKLLLHVLGQVRCW